MSWDTIVADPEFQALEPERKQKIANNYFAKNFESDKDFLSLPEEKRFKIKTNFESTLNQANPFDIAEGKINTSDREPSEASKALKRGLVGVGKQTGLGLEYLAEELKQPTVEISPAITKTLAPFRKQLPQISTNIPQRIESLGKRMVASSEESLKRHPEWQIDPELEKKPWYDPKRLGVKAIEVAPLTVAGIGAGAAAGFVTRNPFIAAGVSGTMFGLTSAGEIFKEAKDAGMSPEDALKPARIGGLSEGALEFVPGYMFMKLLKIGKPLGKVTLQEGIKELGRLRKIAKGMGQIGLTEGFTEGLQTAKNNLIAQRYYEPEREIFKDVPESMALGAIMGVGLGGAGAVTGEVLKPSFVIRQPTKAEVPKFEPETVIKVKGEGLKIEPVTEKPIEKKPIVSHEENIIVQGEKPTIPEKLKEVIASEETEGREAQRGLPLVPGQGTSPEKKGLPAGEVAPVVSKVEELNKIAKKLNLSDLKFKNTIEDKPKKISDILDNPELIEENPILKDTHISYKQIKERDGATSEDFKNIYISPNIPIEKQIEVIKHELSHVLRGGKGVKPGSIYQGEGKGFVDYLSDPEEVLAQSLQTGETIPDLFNEVFKLREKNLKGEIGKVEPLRLKGIKEASKTEIQPDRPFKNTHIENIEGVDYEISASGRLAATEWQEKRLLGKLTKNDPQPKTTTIKTIRLDFGTGNGIIAASFLNENGIKGASSIAPFTTDIPATKENIDKLKELYSKSKRINFPATHTMPSGEVMPGAEHKETIKLKSIYHFTKKENIENILKKGFNTDLPPIHGTGALQKRDVYTKENKSGLGVLYFTTDTKRWNKAQVYTGEGKGTKDYSYYDYETQKWVTEKKAQSTIDLSPLKATIKQNANILVIDSMKKYLAFQEEHLGDAFPRDRIAEVVNLAKGLGYDILNIKYKPKEWIFNEKDFYEEATGAGGKDDYFVFNKDIIDYALDKTETPATPISPIEAKIKKGIQEGESLTSESLIKQGLIRPSTSTFGRKAGRWQYKALDGIFTTTDSKEEAIKKAIAVRESKGKLPLSEEILQEAQVENIFKQIKAITTNVKIDQSFFDHFDRSELISIQRKSPGLFSNKKGMPLDEVADGLGISTDEFADKLRNAISKKQDVELLAKQFKEYIPPLEMVTVADLGLKVGDKFKIHGEKYSVKEKDAEGNFLIEDGDKFIVDEFDKIPIPDEGSLKKGKYVQPKLIEGEKADIKPKMETEVQGQTKLALAFKPEEGFRREISKPQTQQELTKRSDIAKFIQEKFDIPVRIGRVGGGTLGIFKPKLEVTRTKFAHDIETISHEVGHALQKFLWGNLSSRPFKAFEDELIPIATKPRSGQPKSPEGFAEFIRLYSTNNEKALEKAPKFYKYFDELLKEKSPEAREILLETRDRFEKYLTQTPEQRKLSQISINDKGDKKGITLKDIITKFIDELTPLKNIVTEITQGEDIPVIKDPYKLARMMPGVWGKADSFLEYKPFDYNTYEFSGKSLKEILSQIPKDRIDLYRSYQISKSEYESYQNSLKEGGRPFIADPISIQDAKYIIDKYASEFENIFQENIAYRDNLLRYFRDSGMLSGDTYRMFKELYKNYVPLYRVMETEKGTGVGKGLEAYQPIRTRRGSWRDFVDPIESDIKNTYLFITIAEKNGVVNALVDLSNSKAGMGKYVEKIPYPTKKVIIKTEEILSQLSSDPLFSEIIKEFPDIAKVVSIFRKSAFTPKENVISGWKNGEQNLYQVHPDIARTIQSLDTEEINTVIKLLNYPTRWLRAGAVLSPEFLGRNPIRDQFTAFVYSEYGYIPGIDLIRGIYDIANKSKDYWKFKISGAEHSMFVSLDRTTLRKTVDNILSNKSLFHDTFKSAIKNPIELLRVLSEYGEMGTRIGEFKKGLQKEGETKTGLLESGFSSRELSIDFAKKGSLGKVVNMVVAFWNASVQGGVKMYEQHKEEYKAFPKPPKGHRIPLPTTMKAIAAITIPSIVLAVINYDDDKIKEVPQWQKDLFWLIRVGDTIVRIPKPFELGIIYGTLPERIVNYILSKDTHAFDKFIQAFARGALPSAVPTVMLPLMENWANKSYFLDRPIVPASREKVQPEYQYQPYTTEVAKIAGKIVSKFPFIGETSAASPAKIENLVQGWTGGLGRHMLNTLDYGLRKTGIVQGKIRPTATLSDIPLIKGFVVRYPSSSAESIQTFYNNYGKTTQTISTIKSLVKEYQPEKARKLLPGNLLKLNQHYTALNNLSNAIQMIYDNPQIKPDEKRQLIDNYYLQMIAIARNGNRIYEKAGKR